MDLTPFLVGFVVMSLAPLAIYAKGTKRPPGSHHTYLHAAVPFIAATAYLAMTFTIGTVPKIDGTVTLTARYLDWAVTTPLLLTGLVMTALHERDRAFGYLVAIVTLDVLMILAGLISSLAILPVVKWTWFFWSCAAFLGVLYMLWGPLRGASRERGGPLNEAYSRNVIFLTVVWVLYPVVFAVGPEGVRAASTNATSWAILALDVAAKVVYAFYAAGNLERALGQAGTSGRRA